MAWLALQTELAAAEAESWSDSLLAAGAFSVDLADARANTPQETPLFDEPGGGPASAWPYTQLTALFADDINLPALMSVLSREHGKALDYRIAHVPDQDWVRVTQQQFGPIAISDRLYVVPSWHVPLRTDAINLMVDPGLAFGTGSHPTTQLCLLWLEQHIRGGESVIDYGCGSGILAIAAAKLGARNVLGVDIDVQAIVASRDNARRNQVHADFALATVPVSFAADLLVANILANPLRLLAPLLARHVRYGGHVALSGVLADQAENVMGAYRPWFNIAMWRQQEDWVALSGTRSGERA